VRAPESHFDLGSIRQLTMRIDQGKSDYSMAQLLRISIVIPCFNAAKYFKATLVSIARQNYSNVEVIVIDGGSTDNTVAIALGFTQLNLKVISEPDLGQLDAVQKGLKIASGDICHWLNADDVLMPNTLQFVNQTFLKEPALDLIFSDDFAFDEEIRGFGVGATIRNLSYLDHLLFYRQMYSECVFWRSSKTRLLPEHYFHLRLCTDYAFLLNLRYGLREKWVRKRLGAFRIASGQLSERYLDRLSGEREFIQNNAYLRHGWNIGGVWRRRAIRAPLFFVFQYLLPRIDSAFRKIRRIVTRDAMRRAMTTEFFDIWLNIDAHGVEVNTTILER
jgi:glycosyltransferase involved in cell wall biosynthesis